MPSTGSDSDMATTNVEHHSEHRNGNGPTTPAPSPKRRRVWMELAIDNPPHLSVHDDIACDLLPNAQATSSEPEASKDAFGCLGDDKSDALDKGHAGKASGKTVDCARKVDLRDYWQVETATEKEQRHHREWVSHTDSACRNLTKYPHKDT